MNVQEKEIHKLSVLSYVIPLRSEMRFINYFTFWLPKLSGLAHVDEGVLHICTKHVEKYESPGPVQGHSERCGGHGHCKSET